MLLYFLFLAFLRDVWYCQLWDTDLYLLLDIGRLFGPFCRNVWICILLLRLNNLNFLLGFNNLNNLWRNILLPLPIVRGYYDQLSHQPWEIQHKIALAVLPTLVIEVVSCCALSNVVSCMIKPVQQPSGVCNSILVCQGNSWFALLFLSSSMKMWVGHIWWSTGALGLLVVRRPSHSQRQQWCQQGHPHQRCHQVHPPLFARSHQSILDASKADSFHAVLKLKWGMVQANVGHKVTPLTFS